MQLLPQERQIITELRFGPVGEPAYDAHCRDRIAEVHERARRRDEAYRIGREHWESR